MDQLCGIDNNRGNKQRNSDGARADEDPLVLTKELLAPPNDAATHELPQANPFAPPKRTKPTSQQSRPDADAPPLVSFGPLVFHSTVTRRSVGHTTVPTAGDRERRAETARLVTSRLDVAQQALRSRQPVPGAKWGEGAGEVLRGSGGVGRDGSGSDL